jgi:hypothetical protein
MRGKTQMCSIVRMSIEQAVPIIFGSLLISDTFCLFPMSGRAESRDVTGLDF